MPTKRKARRGAKEEKPRDSEAVEIGERIRTAREALGLSRWELAARLRGWDAQIDSKASKISQYENGHHKPTKVGRRKEIAEVLKTTTGHLFGEAQDPEVEDRIDLIERKVDAVIAIEGIGDLVDSLILESRQADRRRAREAAKDEAATPDSAAAQAVQAAKTAQAKTRKSQRQSRGKQSPKGSKRQAG